MAKRWQRQIVFRRDLRAYLVQRINAHAKTAVGQDHGQEAVRQIGIGDVRREADDVGQGLQVGFALPNGGKNAIAGHKFGLQFSVFGFRWYVVRLPLT